MNTEKNNNFVASIYDRIEKNKNFLCVAVGQTGSGKSYGVLRLAEKIDPDFTIKRVGFSPMDFLKLASDEKLHTGSVIVYDECGVGMDARTWHSVSNKMINYLLQTFRYRNLITFFTVPDLGFIDKNARKLVHCVLETVRIEGRTTLIMKPFMIHNNPMNTDEPFRKYMKYKSGGVVKTINQLDLRKPSRELQKEYEAKKHVFAQILYKGAEHEIGAVDTIHNVELTERQKECYEMAVSGMTQDVIAGKLMVNRSSITAALRACKKKGYDYKKELRKRGISRSHNKLVAFV